MKKKAKAGVDDGRRHGVVLYKDTVFDLEGAELLWTGLPVSNCFEESGAPRLYLLGRVRGVPVFAIERHFQFLIPGDAEAVVDDLGDLVLHHAELRAVLIKHRALRLPDPVKPVNISSNPEVPAFVMPTILGEPWTPGKARTGIHAYYNALQVLVLNHDVNPPVVCCAAHRASEHTTEPNVGLRYVKACKAGTDWARILDLPFNGAHETTDSCMEITPRIPR